MNDTTQMGTVEQAIRARCTVKPDRMNGKAIKDETVLELLALADRAPTHAKTEPWRFIVFGNDQVKAFANRHAGLFREHTSEASFTEMKFNNIVKLGDNVSHIIVAWMKRVPTHKIPEIEEIAATAAAIQNLLIAAASKGIASFWSTGGLTHHPAFRAEFNLGEEDRIMGILYVGYTDEPFNETQRIIPLSEKIEWRK